MRLGQLGLTARRSTFVSVVVLACSVPSCDEATVSVPDVVGESIAAGAQELQSLGLCVLVQQGSGPDLGRRIDRQSPASDALATEGSLVTITTNSVEDVLNELKEIGRRNEEMSCRRGTGIGGEGGTAYRR